MAMIADILLAAGALGAGFYCHVLARRLRRFTDLEKGVGGAVAVLSVQVDDLTKSVQQAQSAAAESVTTLSTVSERAEKAARHLELLVASLHDLPAETVPPPPKVQKQSTHPFFVRRKPTEKSLS
jgi:hypothetical protein